MHKIKQFTTAKQLAKFKILLAIFLAGFVLTTGSQPAAAAPPGCYQRNASSQGVSSSTQIDCGEGENPAPLCRLTTVSGAGSQTDDVDCGDIVTASGQISFSLNGDAGIGSEIYCGKGDKQVQISFDIGCLGNAYNGKEYSPILDMLFALIRFLSAGVGLVVIGSIIYAGIQYSASRGNPQSTEAAIKRVANSMFALLLYLFSFALLNFLVPGGLFV